MSWYLHSGEEPSRSRSNQLSIANRCRIMPGYLWVPCGRPQPWPLRGATPGPSQRARTRARRGEAVPGANCGGARPAHSRNSNRVGLAYHNGTHASPRITTRSDHESVILFTCLLLAVARRYSWLRNHDRQSRSITGFITLSSSSDSSPRAST